jgi:Xaa-Pro dipeptidase
MNRTTVSWRGGNRCGRGGAGCVASTTTSTGSSTSSDTPEAIRALTPMRDGIVPIADDERRARIAKAQKLMAEQKIDAIFMEGTASCFYFADMRWGQSERTFGVVIRPRASRIRRARSSKKTGRARLIKFGNDVRTWEEHESPYA